MIAVLMLIQTAAVPLPAAQPDRFSILAPVPTAPCRARGPVEGDDILVCGTSVPTQRLPLPEERDPPAGRGVNPELTPDGALAAQAAPCNSLQGGCQVGFDFIGLGVTLARLGINAVKPGATELTDPTDPVSLVAGAVRSTKRAMAAKPDTAKRVPIDLDGPGPAGRIVTMPSRPAHP